MSSSYLSDSCPWIMSRVTTRLIPMCRWSRVPTHICIYIVCMYRALHRRIYIYIYNICFYHTAYRAGCPNCQRPHSRGYVTLHGGIKQYGNPKGGYGTSISIIYKKRDANHAITRVLGLTYAPCMDTYTNKYWQIFFYKFYYIILFFLQCFLYII